MNTSKAVKGLVQEKAKLLAQVRKLDQAISVLEGINSPVPVRERQKFVAPEREARKRHPVFHKQFKNTCQNPECKRTFKSKKRKAAICDRKACRNWRMRNSAYYLAKYGRPGLSREQRTAQQVSNVVKKAKPTVLIPGDTLTAGH